jgi:hypothetical protein
MKQGPPLSGVESRGADSDVERNRRLQQGSILDIRYFWPVAS